MHTFIHIHTYIHTGAGAAASGGEPAWALEGKAAQLLELFESYGPVDGLLSGGWVAGWLAGWWGCVCVCFACVAGSNEWHK